MKADTFFSGLIVAGRIYGLAVAYFWPGKLSPRMPPRLFYTLCLVMIIGGLLLAVLSPWFNKH